VQDICSRTFIAVFHLGAYFARMQPGEVQCSYDDAAQYGNRQVGNNGITVTAMITDASSQGTLPGTRSDPHAKV
jgi:hypothetical protein